MDDYPHPSLPIVCGDYEVKHSFDDNGLYNLYIAENTKNPAETCLAMFFFYRHAIHMTTLCELLSANSAFTLIDASQCKAKTDEHDSRKEIIFCVLFSSFDGGLHELVSPSVFDNGHAILSLTSLVLPVQGTTVSLVKTAITQELDTLTALGYAIMNPKLSDFLILVSAQGIISVLLYNTLKITRIESTDKAREAALKTNTEEMFQQFNSLKPVEEAFYQYGQVSSGIVIPKLSYY